MLKQKLITKSIHKLFSFLPEETLCYLGTCKSTCLNIAMQENIDIIESVKVRAHLLVCNKCFNYYHQLKIVNKIAINGIRLEIEKRTPLDKDLNKSCDVLINKYSIKKLN